MGIKGQKAWNKVQVSDELIRHLYIEKQMPARECAKELKIGITPVFRKLRELGITRTNSEAQKGLQQGEKNPNWKGGRHICKNTGYIIIPDGTGGMLREHRVIAEKKIGRVLRAGEVVHHIDGNPSNNHPDNLEVLPSQSEHMKIHMTPGEARRRGLMTKRSKAALLAAMETE